MPNNKDKIDISCHAYYGAYDLYHGVPDILDGIVEDISYPSKGVTILHIKRKNGDYCNIQID